MKKGICTWCGELRDIVAEKAGNDDGVVELFCEECALEKGFITPNYDVAESVGKHTIRRNDGDE